MIFKLINIEILLIFSCFITTVFVLWFNTNMMVEYGRLFKLNKILLLEDYNNYIYENLDGNYISFLATRGDSFFLRLITCPFCLGVWYSGGISLVLGLIYFCPLYLLSLFLYFVIIRLSTYGNSSDLNS